MNIESERVKRSIKEFFQSELMKMFTINPNDA